MSSEARQRALAVLLPSIVTAVFYFTFVGFPAMRSQQPASQGDAQATATQTKRQQELARRRELRTTRERLAELEQARQRALGLLDSSRGERLARVAELVERSGLRLDRESDLVRPAGTLPASLAQITRWRTDQARGKGGPPAALPSRKLVVRGRFAQVAQLLRDLRKETELFVVGLELHAPKANETTSAGRRWTIVVWG